jgi:hypothetical protein
MQLGFKDNLRIFSKKIQKTKRVSLYVQKNRRTLLPTLDAALSQTSTVIIFVAMPKFITLLTLTYANDFRIRTLTFRLP